MPQLLGDDLRFRASAADKASSWSLSGLFGGVSGYICGVWRRVIFKLCCEIYNRTYSMCDIVSIFQLIEHGYE